MALSEAIREMGGAPRNPPFRNHLLVWIVKPPGCHCTYAFGGKLYRRSPTPLRSTSPFSEASIAPGRVELEQPRGEGLLRLCRAAGSPKLDLREHV